MTDKIYTINQIKEYMTPVFVQYGIKKAVLFGSYRNEMANENSDIDILVDSGLKGLSFVGFIEDLKNSVDKDVDVFDISHIEKGTIIDKEINDTGVLIYEK